MTTEIYKEPVFRIYGDQGLLMEFGSSISPLIHEQVRAMSIGLEHRSIKGVVECVSGYRSVAVLYDPFVTSFYILRKELEKIYSSLGEITIPPPEVIEIPVCYEGEFGPDLPFVAKTNNLSEEEVIKIHSSQKYLIYMLGFTPGFPFLGGLPKSICTPRLESPRKKVPAGAVGIANDQTGVYPIESPGGWQIIGRTPTQLFDLDSDNPFLLSSGNFLKFRPVSEQEFEKSKKRRGNS